MRNTSAWNKLAATLEKWFRQSIQNMERRLEGQEFEAEIEIPDEIQGQQEEAPPVQFDPFQTGGFGSSGFGDSYDAFARLTQGAEEEPESGEDFSKQHEQEKEEAIQREAERVIEEAVMSAFEEESRKLK